MLTQGSETRTSENAAFYDLHLLGQKGLHSLDSFAATVLVKSHKVQPVEANRINHVPLHPDTVAAPGARKFGCDIELAVVRHYVGGSRFWGLAQ